MIGVLRLLLQLCALQRGPQDLPHSANLTRVLVLASVAVDLLFVRMTEGGSNGEVRIVLSLALLLGLPWLILGWRGHRARYAQTLAAFAGTGAVFTLVVLPVAIEAAALPVLERGVEPTRAQLVMAWVTLLLVGWKLAINGHIWKHALDWPRAGGLLLAIGVMLFEFGLMRALLQPATD
jgi:hypothetical protein